ncbi:MAG: bifunctional 2-polyprenyl-6-hydroxyphenol methylase/3-demethylubiquinol 3-O-methyltransferase UbiG [Alphaproteobacteria bacterium]|nr:MAG: bifunctional 2-polyprenyl-6-hydroxyphenol methylase/3-demethylubiquinol 3-O-methyltransferase UbiG [Alphaproteobacteria bacterium]
MAEQWWDPEGKFRPLHRLNPVRLRFIRDRAAAHFGRDPTARRSLEGLKVLDIGCGGGLLCEPLARLGARVIGVDAAERNVAVARAHAVESGLSIDYRHAVAEDLTRLKARFDIVLAMEIVEHVADLPAFVATCAALVRPGGVLFAATLNRTAKSFLFAIVGAEYVLRWLPRGTHDWRRFVRPSELVEMLRRAGLSVEEIVGVTYNPLSDTWNLGRDLDVNYMVFASATPPATTATAESRN